ncbi:MAG TPA: hypothetical protein VGX76_20000, partial [Pirellulales bacterium]|nr:hypothetical protein [Pirellulales bacterium]
MRNAPEILDLDRTQLEEILRRLEQAKPLAEKDAELIRKICESYVYMTGLLGDKNTSIRRLRNLLFGPCTEKTAAVVGRISATPAAAPAAGAATTPGSSSAAPDGGTSAELSSAAPDG